MLKLEHKNSLTHYIDKFNLRNIFTFNLENLIELHCFRKNEIILEKNTKPDYLYLLVEGSINLESNLEINDYYINFYYEKASFLGSLEIFLDENLKYSIVAREDCICIAISKNNIFKVAFNDPHFLKFFCKIFSCKLYNNSFFNFLTKEKDAI